MQNREHHGKMNVVNIEDLLSRSQLQPTARSSGASLFDFSDSERLLDLCEHVGIGVLGIEGFELADGNLYPDMNYIGDFSALLDRDDFQVQSIKSARQFLELTEKSSHLLFEYLLTRPDG